MKCEQVKYQIIDYIDHNLSEDLNKEIASHLASCATCEEEYIQTGKLLNELNKTEDIQPSDNLKSNFYQMLSAKKEETLSQKTFTLKSSVSTNKWIKIAAQIIILLGIGVLIGGRLSFNRQSEQIAHLNSKVINLETSVTLTSLNQPTASQRLKAINTSYTIHEPNPELIDALIQTMNTDKNINVRMAAMYALSNYSDNETVKTALIESINIQTDPLLQISLINIAVNLQDNRAKEPLQQIIENEANSNEVKEQAKKGLKIFI